MSLADRYPDKVLFQILRHDQTRLQSYGVSHSLHCAAVCCLTGKRMGWDDNQRRMLVSAAMSMRPDTSGRMRPPRRLRMRNCSIAATTM